MVLGSMFNTAKQSTYINTDVNMLELFYRTTTAEGREIPYDTNLKQCTARFISTYVRCIYSKHIQFELCYIY